MAESPQPRSASHDHTAALFSQLATRRHEPLLRRGSGTLRFDLVDGDEVRHWYLTVSNGDVAVSHDSGEADCVTRVDASTFEDLVTGRTNAMATFLRGGLTAEGDPSLLLMFQRLFPGPEKEAVAS
jgi:putative sterol carrier protein